MAESLHLVEDWRLQTGKVLVQTVPVVKPQQIAVDYDKRFALLRLHDSRSSRIVDPDKAIVEVLECGDVSHWKLPSSTYNLKKSIW